MEITISNVEARVPVTIFKLDGMLNMGTSGSLQQSAIEQHEAGMRYMLLDLGEVTSLSSAGLRTIQFIYKFLQADGDLTTDRQSGKKSSYVKILNPRPEIQRVISIAGFDTFIEIFTDRTEALNSF
jgi:anti-anti-sigma factor